MFFYRFSPFCSGEKKYAKATPVKEVCNVAPSGLMTPRDAAVYIGVKNQHACRLAYDKSLRIAVRQTGKSHTIPKIRLGRMD